MDNTLYFMHLTKEQFDTITTKNENVLYFVLVGNEYKFYKGNQEILISNEKMPEKLKEILQGAEKEYDTFKELSEALKKNKDLISSLNTLINDKVGKTDLATKQDKLVSNQNIKTINGQEILGSGDVKVREYPEVKPHINDFLTKNEKIYLSEDLALDAWVPSFYYETDESSDNSGKTSDTVDELPYAPVSVISIVNEAVKKTDEVYKITNTFKEVKEDIARKVGKDELDKKQDTLKDKINIKTINERSILGQGNLNIREFPREYPDNIPGEVADFLKGRFMSLSNNALMNKKFYIPAFNNDQAYKINTKLLLNMTGKSIITFHNPDNNTFELDYQFDGTNKLVIKKPFAPIRYYQVDINLSRGDNVIELLTVNLIIDYLEILDKGISFSSLHTNFILNFKLRDNGSLEIELTDKGNYQGYDITKSKIRIVKTNG